MQVLDHHHIGEQSGDRPGEGLGRSDQIGGPAALIGARPGTGSWSIGGDQHPRLAGLRLPDVSEGVHGHVHRLGSGGIGEVSQRRSDRVLVPGLHGEQVSDRAEHSG